MIISSTGGVGLTKISIMGLEKNTNYWLYDGNNMEETKFTSDENGNYSIRLDLKETQNLMIKPEPSTIYIRDDDTGGDCIIVGEWNLRSKTCHLNQDINSTLSDWIYK